MACGFALAACTMSMPSLDFFRSTPPTEMLRIESEPPGADARTTLGQNCRTPCELTVPAGQSLDVPLTTSRHRGPHSVHRNSRPQSGTDIPAS